MLQRGKISQILKSMTPQDKEEVSLLQFVLYCAQLIHRGGHTDLSFGGDRLAMSRNPHTPNLDVDAHEFLEAIPEDSKRYFYGLVEAIDIYQTIHGQSLVVGDIKPTDRSVYELRQIRDMCLEKDLHSVY